ncbi:Rv3235 family protein [Isoptericola dokdonensis]|jgi:hypothetical protein|uniref:Uncharacterized protein n=1 Tax=Isoptericola dokdonensis DS-3 TaxID=1300344 RepID=A0A161IA15_9MICO|nr:Rv3235 family protein [Isoptericola dokdonensis]ANC32888.1 hypothetical protein I598_3379 [Isoptericola dokdonensis DS-3]
MTAVAPPHTAPARTLRVTAPPVRRRPAEPPSAPRRPGPVRRVRVGAPVAPPVPVPGAPGESPSAPPELGDPTALCCSIVRAAVEVLRDERPATQVARWVAPAVLDHLVERARLVRAARPARQRRRGAPVTVRRVRMLRLGAGTAEASVVLDDDGRVRAAAVRLEAHRGQWRVVVLELG